MSVVEEEDVGGDGSIGSEHTARHPDYGVKIEILKQLFLQIDLCVVQAEQESVWENNRYPSVFPEPVHDYRHEQVCGLAACKIIREVILHIVLLAATIRRVHQDDIELVIFCVIEKVSQQRVVMEYLRGVYVMKKHVCDAEHVRELLLFNTVD